MLQLWLPEDRIPEIPDLLEKNVHRVHEMQEKGFCACMVRG